MSITEHKLSSSVKNNGTTFFLKASTETLAKRIHNTEKRPLLTNRVNLQSRLEEIWNERIKFYNNSAHYVIETDNLNPTQLLDEILNLLEFSFENH